METKIKNETKIKKEIKIKNETKIKQNQEGDQNQEASKTTQIKTKKVKLLVSNQYCLVDIPNHAAGVEDGAWTFFFFLFSC